MAERTLDPEPPDSWLYLRDRHSVRILSVGANELAIYGPGHRRSVIAFANDSERNAFRQQSAAALLAAGYVLRGFRVERRRGADRRVVPRASDERRQDS
jgi:hypothetical protein